MDAKALCAQEAGRTKGTTDNHIRYEKTIYSALVCNASTQAHATLSVSETTEGDLKGGRKRHEP